MWISAAGRAPLRQRRAAPELDVVGMRADGEHASGTGRSTSRSCTVAGVDGRSGLASRELGEVVDRVDVEGERGSRTTRTARPARAAAATWRRNEPGPYANANSGAVPGGGDGQHRRAVVAVAGHEHRDRTVGVVGRPARTTRTKGRSAWAITARWHPTCRERGDAGSRRRRRAIPGSATTCASWPAAHAMTSGALVTTTTGAVPAAATTRSARRTAQSGASSRRRVPDERRVLPSAKVRMGTTTPNRVVRHGAAYATGRARSPAPGARS